MSEVSSKWCDVMCWHVKYASESNCKWEYSQSWYKQLRKLKSFFMFHHLIVSHKLFHLHLNFSYVTTLRLAITFVDKYISFCILFISCLCNSKRKYYQIMNSLITIIYDSYYRIALQIVLIWYLLYLHFLLCLSIHLERTICNMRKL